MDAMFSTPVQTGSMANPSSYTVVLFAGGLLTINACPPGRTLRSVAEREYLGVMLRGKW